MLALLGVGFRFGDLILLKSDDENLRRSRKRRTEFWVAMCFNMEGLVAW